MLIRKHNYDTIIKNDEQVLLSRSCRIYELKSVYNEFHHVSEELAGEKKNTIVRKYNTINDS